MAPEGLATSVPARLRGRTRPTSRAVVVLPFVAEIRVDAARQLRAELGQRLGTQPQQHLAGQAGSAAPPQAAREGPAARARVSEGADTPGIVAAAAAAGRGAPVPSGRPTRTRSSEAWKSPWSTTPEIAVGAAGHGAPVGAGGAPAGRGSPGRRRCGPGAGAGARSASSAATARPRRTGPPRPAAAPHSSREPTSFGRVHQHQEARRRRRPPAARAPGRRPRPSRSARPGRRRRRRRTRCRGGCAGAPTRDAQLARQRRRSPARSAPRVQRSPPATRLAQRADARRRGAAGAEPDRACRPRPRAAAASPAAAQARRSRSSTAEGYATIRGWRRSRPGSAMVDTLLGGMEQRHRRVPRRRRAARRWSTPAPARRPRPCGDALAAAGHRPRTTCAWIVLTHVHLDHCGATGILARPSRGRRVVVHRPRRPPPGRARPPGRGIGGGLRGALVAVRRPRPHPRRPHRRRRRRPPRAALGAGPATCVMLETAGHARHHMAVHDEATGTVFAGDAVGACASGGAALPGAAAAGRRPRRRRAQPGALAGAADPSACCLPHFGPVPDPARRSPLAAAADAAGARRGRGRRPRTARPWRAALERRAAARRDRRRPRPSVARLRAAGLGAANVDGLQAWARERRGVIVCVT